MKLEKMNNIFSIFLEQTQQFITTLFGSQKVCLLHNHVIVLLALRKIHSNQDILRVWTGFIPYWKIDPSSKEIKLITA